MDKETKVVLDEILATLTSLDERVTNMESKITSSTFQIPNSDVKTERKFSVKEFLIDRAPNDAVQTTLVIGYFLEMYEGMKSFNRADIEKGFRAAKEKLPTNINDKVNLCIKNSHMMEAGEKKDSMKSWSLTRTGEELVKKGFKKVSH